MEETTESCGTEKHGRCGSNESNEGYHHFMNVDPVEQSIMMWRRAFFHAMHEAQVEFMKKRIESTYGPVMEKSADAVFESFGKFWQSRQLQSEAKKDLESKLQKIFSETSRR